MVCTPTTTTPTVIPTDNSLVTIDTHKHKQSDITDCLVSGFDVLPRTEK